MLAQLCEVNHVLHEAQMRSRKQRRVIDAMARTFNRVQEVWAEGKLSSMLLINMKGAFDDISTNYLLSTMKDMSGSRDLMG